MLKKMLCATGITLLLAFSNAQAAKYDAAHVAKVKDGAERGDAFAQCILADCYDFADCEGIPHDYTEARKWYEKAATQGKDTAQFNLGLMYYKGKGVPQDYAKALEWWEKAAAQGHAKAQTNLGVMYVKGQGVSQNALTAKEWFCKACDNGEQTGCDAYRRLKEAGF